MGLTPAGVAAYHDVYFDDRPRLKAPVYILGVVLGGGRAFHAPEPSDRGLLLKLVGYQMGEPAVDALLDHFREPPSVPASLDGLDLPALTRLRDKLRTKILVLLLTTPAEAAHPATWLGLWQRFAAGGGEREGGEGQEAVLASAEALLDVLATLSKGEPAKDPAAAAVA
jgi:hypothetical protein